MERDEHEENDTKDEKGGRGGYSTDHVGQKYQITGLPETFIVDKQGVLREQIFLSARRDSSKNRQLLMEYINQ